MLALIIAFIALTADVMRTVYAGYKLQYGTEAAALAAYSTAVDHSGTFNKGNITAKLDEVSGLFGSPWNKAPAGPDSNLNANETAITFASQDLAFERNLNDSGEEFMRLTARRDGLDSIKLFFVPAIFAFNSLVGIPTPSGSGVNLANPFRTTEVFSQPASRVGEGVPGNAPNSQRNHELRGFATFPFAISNNQFLTAASTGGAHAIYTIDLASNINPPPVVLQAGHFRGSFLNIRASGSNLNSYNSGQGANAVSDLENLIDFFQATDQSSSVAPFVVERGSLVNTIDPESSEFKSRETLIKTKLNSVVATNRFQILPVLANDPVIGDNLTNNAVVGFARMRFINIVNSTNGNFQIQLEIGDSLPTRNTTSTNSYATIPTVNGALLPRPVAPFTARNSGTNGQSIGAKPVGVVLSASISPRIPNSIEVTTP